MQESLANQGFLMPVPVLQVLLVVLPPKSDIFCFNLAESSTSELRAISWASVHISEAAVQVCVQLSPDAPMCHAPHGGGEGGGGEGGGEGGGGEGGIGGGRGGHFGRLTPVRQSLSKLQWPLLHWSVATPLPAPWLQEEDVLIKEPPKTSSASAIIQVSCIDLLLGWVQSSVTPVTFWK